jgi:hypothetical protein
MIKAIETQYKGYRFRSRLEARWALYFDDAGIEWDYEPEGFDLGDAGYYLPDFYLPKEGKWAEVKAKSLNANEREKAFALSSHCGLPVICLNNIPDPEMGLYSDNLVNIEFYIGADSDYSKDCWFANDLIQFYLDNACGNVEDLTKSDSILRDALSWDIQYYKDKHNEKHPHHFENGYVKNLECLTSKNLKRSLTKARSARFEHGEKG